MKKMIFTLCAAASLATAQAQDTYLMTDFSEGIPSTFTLVDNDGRTPSTDMQKLGFAVGTPWVAADEGKNGNMVAASTSWYKNAGQSDDWMITPPVNVKEAKAVLSWRAKASDKD